MTYHHLLRVTEKVSLARSLSVLGDHAGAEEIWEDAKKDVATVGFQLGRSLPYGSPADPHPLIQENALGSIYLRAFEDGQAERSSMGLQTV